MLKNNFKAMIFIKKVNKVREKQSSALVKINDIRKVVESAENYSIKRMVIVFSNSEHRLKDIPEISPIHHVTLEELTDNCIDKINENQSEGFNLYKTQLGDLLNKITDEINPSIFLPVA